MRYTGTITRWQDEKGFGFIEPDGGGRPVFIHATAFAYTRRRPGDGERVTYVLSTDQRGRPCAGDVTYIEDRATPSASKGAPVGVLVSAVFLLFLAGAVLMHRLPIIVLAGYLALSFITFLVYGHDKNAAQNGEWRVAEATLHLLELAGGWPGALFAQHTLRHKSRKESFLVGFWIAALLNCGMLGWLFTPQGSAFARSLSGR